MDSFIRAMHGVEQIMKDVTMALNICVVADKYRVDLLKEQAKKFVISNLDCENVINICVCCHPSVKFGRYTGDGT